MFAQSPKCNFLEKLRSTAGRRGRWRFRRRGKLLSTSVVEHPPPHPTSRVSKGMEMLWASPKQRRRAYPPQIEFVAVLVLHWQASKTPMAAVAVAEQWQPQQQIHSAAAEGTRRTNLLQAPEPLTRGVTAHRLRRSSFRSPLHRPRKTVRGH